MPPGDANRLTSLLAREVGADRDVLVISSEPRDMAPLEELGCRVVMWSHDRDDWESLEKLDEKRFDVVLLDHSLEQVPDPLRLLTAVHPVLRPGGRLLVTADNVLHGARRLAVLSGHWSSRGEADVRRHLDPLSLANLLHAAEFKVDTITATVVDPLGAGELPTRSLPPEIVEWVRDQPGAYERDLLAVATLGSAPGEAREVTVEHVVEPAAVRRRDAYTRAALDHGRELQDLRHRLMTMRDHVIGLEAEAVAARRRQQTAEVRANRATARADRLMKRALRAERKARRSEAKAVAATRSARRNRRQAEKQLADLRASRTYRAGRLLTAPLRIFRRG
jgi:SAM-dependent methyltransferase